MELVNLPPISGPLFHTTPTAKVLYFNFQSALHFLPTLESSLSLEEEFQRNGRPSATEGDDLTSIPQTLARDKSDVWELTYPGERVYKSYSPQHRLI